MEKYEAVVLVKHRAFVQLKTALQKMMPADIAQLLSEMIEEQDGFGEKGAYPHFQSSSQGACSRNFYLYEQRSADAAYQRIL